MSKVGDNSVDMCIKDDFYLSQKMPRMAVDKDFYDF